MLSLAEIAGWLVAPRFYRTGTAAIAAQEADPSLVLFGIGGRDNVSADMLVIDEHQEGGRVEGECGATLVAKHLGLSERPELADFLAYSLRADSEGGQKFLELAEAIKTLHGYTDLGDEGVWTEVIRPCHRAVLSHARGDTAQDVPEFGSFLGSEVPVKRATIRKIVLPERPDWQSCVGAWVLAVLGNGNWKVARDVEFVFTDDIDEAWHFRCEEGTVVLGIGDGPWGDTDLNLELHPECLPMRIAQHLSTGVRKGAAKLILEECKRWHADSSVVLPYELPTLIERLRTHGELDSRGILQLVVHVLSARYQRSQAFQEAGQIEPDHVETVGAMKIAVTLSENGEIVGSLRGRGKSNPAKKMDVIVLRKESGNVNIFLVTPEAQAALPEIARRLTIAESLARGEGDPIADRLIALAEAGEQAWKGYALLGSGDETWYVSYGAIHNGTTTHPDVPPTKLSAEDLVVVLKEAIASIRS